MARLSENYVRTLGSYRNITVLSAVLLFACAALVVWWQVQRALA